MAWRLCAIIMPRKRRLGLQIVKYVQTSAGLGQWEKSPDR
jgi:hypothetical protein